MEEFLALREFVVLAELFAELVGKVRGLAILTLTFWLDHY